MLILWYCSVAVEKCNFMQKFSLKYFPQN